ncbi:hypothetical protein E8E14_009165 [Neopestalotiopsis sp. 37M]|nr:hypothetical protein E8E14_009165 [Neopestalotiopsis sp. 37M]
MAMVATSPPPVGLLPTARTGSSSHMMINSTTKEVGGGGGGGSSGTTKPNKPTTTAPLPIKSLDQHQLSPVARQLLGEAKRSRIDRWRSEIDLSEVVCSCSEHPECVGIRMAMATPSAIVATVTKQASTTTTTAATQMYRQDEADDEASGSLDGDGAGDDGTNKIGGKPRLRLDDAAARMRRAQKLLNAQRKG